MAIQRLDPSVYAEMEKQCLDLFTYEQRFFFLNGPRTTGKTYSLQKIMVQKALRTGCEIGYFCRTKDEWDNDITMVAFEKVLANEFPDLVCVPKKHDVWCKPRGEETQWRRLIVGFPISQYYKWKNMSFPLVNFALFDEYMLEVKNGITQGRYINGYDEPDAFINMYNTIDRAEGRLKVFFCGNNTSFYNPYHVHPLFKEAFRRVPRKGERVKTSNVVFWRVEPSEALAAFLASTGLAKMAEGTTYGDYAFNGEYQDDVSSVIPLCPGAKTIFALRYNNSTVYVHEGTHSDGQRALWLSEKGAAHTQVYAVRGNDVSVSVPIFLGTYWSEVFSTLHRSGRVFFGSQRAKTMCSDFLYLILSWYRKG